MPTSPRARQFSHLTPAGEARMVDVSAKPPLTRTAVADGVLTLQRSTVTQLKAGALPKGDVLAVARVAGIQAAKETARLIPLCHQLPLSSVTISFNVRRDRIGITATVKTTAQTGVEMEALTAVSVAALTLYDMCKAVDKTMTLTGIRLVEKTKTPPAARAT